MSIRLPAILQVFKVDTSDLQRAQMDAERVGGGLGAGIAKGVAVGGAALAGLGAIGVTSAMGIEKGLAEVVTLTGKTGAEAKAAMGEFGEGVRGVSDEFGIAQDTLTSGLYQALSAGVPQDNVFDFLQVASKASIAGVTDVDVAVDGISSTLNAFGLDAAEAGAVADSMFAAVAGGKTTFEELSSSVATVAPAAAAAGVGFDEVFAGVATLTSAGKSTSEATTMMRAALSSIQRPTEALTEAFQDAGYESAEAALAQDGLAAALQVVQDASGGSAGELTKMLGSVEAVGAAQIIAGTGAEKMAEEMDRQANAAGSVDDAFSVMSETADFAWQQLKTGLMNGLTELGAKALPKVNSALRTAAGAFRWASDNAATLRPWLIGIGTAITAFVLPPLLVYIQQQALAGAAAVRSAAQQYVASLRVIASWVAQGAAALLHGAQAVAGWAMGGAGAVRSAAQQVAAGARVVAGWVLMGVQSLAAAAKVALAWMISMGPIALVIAAVVGLVVVIVKNWETIKNAITKAAKAAWDFVVKAFNAVKGAVTTAVNAVRSAVQKAWNAVTSAISSAVNRVRSLVTSAFNAVRTTVTTAVNAVVSFVRGLPGKFLSALGSLASTLRGVASRAWTAFRSAIATGTQGVLSYIKDTPRRILSNLGNLGRLLINSGKALLRGFVSGIKSMASAPVDAVKGMVSKVRNLLPFSPAKEGPFSGRGWVTYSGQAIAEGLAAGIDARQRTARSAAHGLARTTASALAAGLADGTSVLADVPVRLAGTVEANAAGGATAQLATSLRAELGGLRQALAEAGDRPIEAVLDLGDGIRQRYRIERTREAAARAVQIGAR